MRSQSSPPKMARRMRCLLPLAASATVLFLHGRPSAQMRDPIPTENRSINAIRKTPVADQTGGGGALFAASMVCASIAPARPFPNTLASSPLPQTMLRPRSCCVTCGGTNTCGFCIYTSCGSCCAQ